MLEHALKYSEVFKVFPLVPNTKIPFSKEREPSLEGGFHVATQDQAKISQWWQKHPRANIGVILTETPYFVLDFDVKGKDNGLITFKSLDINNNKTALESLIELGEELAGYHTPSGGLHLYFETDNERLLTINKTNLFNGVDVYGADHYLIVPPSVVDGRAYGQEDDSDFDIHQIPKAPPWLEKLLIEQLDTKTKKTAFTTRKMPTRQYKGRIPQLVEEAYEGIHSGERNVFFAKAFGVLLAAKINPVVAMEVCTNWNNHYTNPPLTEKELYGIFESILKRETSKNNS